ncbi:MAG: YncE family protein [Deltaproteobacteria bacterium]|nr:MAG: YncE family protein [Deltaproteobacteria bacterium]
MGVPGILVGCAAAALLARGVLAGAPEGAVAGKPARAGQHDVLFVANVVDGTITLIDTQSLERLGALNAIPDGKTPQDPAQAAIYPGLLAARGPIYAYGVKVAPDGSRVYVSRGHLGDVVAIELATGKILWRFQTNSRRADHTALSPDGSRLFVSAIAANEVQVLDTQSGKLAGSFVAGTRPHVLSFTPDGKHVYNGSLGIASPELPGSRSGPKQLTVADAKTLEVVRILPFERGVRPFAFTPNGSLLYVQFSDGDGFSEVNPVTGAILRTKRLPVVGTPSTDPNEAPHHGIAVSMDGKTICDAAKLYDYIALVDRASFETLATIAVPGGLPIEAENSSDGRYCFVANRNGNTVSVISYESRREVRRIPAGVGPHELTEASVPEAILRAGGFLK